MYYSNVVPLNKQHLQYSNCIYTNFSELKFNNDINYVLINKFPVKIQNDDDLEFNTVAIPSYMRTMLNLELFSQVSFEKYVGNAFVENELQTNLQCKLELVSKYKTVIAENELKEKFLEQFNNFLVKENTVLIMNYNNRAIKLTVLKCNNVIKITAINTSLTFLSVDNPLLVFQACETVNYINPNFSFEELNIGGLDEQFTKMFRNVFASRMYNKELIKQMNITHVKGILLHGPPGCGKTLVARHIGKILNCSDIKVINGPEVLNKYVGASEEKIRELFLDAEIDQEKNQDNGKLHVLIFDEIDAICKSRGSSNSSTGVNDNIVNQLLTKIDGVKPLNNILIIGMTNRKDLIDEALLRPGRLEVHIEIGLPDELGRLQIFNIHTNALRASNSLEENLDVKLLCDKMKNFTGAEIQGVVRNATSNALFGEISGQVTSEFKIPDLKHIVVTYGHFERAISEINPVAGSKSSELSEYYDTDGISLYDMPFNIDENHKLCSILLIHQDSKVLTARACLIAQNLNYPYVKIISSEDLVCLSEQTRAEKIKKIFDMSYLSNKSVIILDDLLKLVDYGNIGYKYSNLLLQTLLVLITKAPRKKEHSLVVICTTSNLQITEELGFKFNKII